MPRRGCGRLSRNGRRSGRLSKRDGIPKTALGPARSLRYVELLCLHQAVHGNLFGEVEFHFRKRQRDIVIGKCFPD